MKVNGPLQTFDDNIGEHMRSTDGVVWGATKHRKLVTVKNMSEKALWFGQTFDLLPKSVKLHDKDGKDMTVQLSAKKK